MAMQTQTLLEAATENKEEAKKATKKEQAIMQTQTLLEAATENKEEAKKATKKEQAIMQDASMSHTHTNLESFKNSLSSQEKKTLNQFMQSSVFDSFMTYLEGFFRDKDTIIHRINCFCFKAKEDVSIRIHGRIYTIKQGEIVYVQKDSFGNAMLRNNKLERII
ncbi:hypothetical protein [Helicobacter trogontum]|uniref:Uncharacterized protein n=1 Tax=Helicobacter trogontum TaxID=50960 RepID=A0A4U8SDQ4_9HELI|nr:hypothetical protein [Helicobacter trogontum]TLD84254.1 hypothetical protein LS81_001965 [Helicobacter trogontum]